MPVLHVNLSDHADVRSAIEILARQIGASAQAHQAPPMQPFLQAIAEIQQKQIWPFLYRVANLDVPEYSLSELGRHIGLSTNKVGSLKAILAKPEQRLGVRFFEPVPSGAEDEAGNPRYRMPDAIRQAIKAARTIHTVGDLIEHSQEFFTLSIKDRKKVARWAGWAVRMIWDRTGHREAYAVGRADSEILNFIQRHPRVLRCVKHIWEKNRDDKVLKYITPGAACGLLYLMGSAKSNPVAYSTSAQPREDLLDWGLWDRACDFWTLLADESDEFAPLRRAHGEALSKSDDGKISRSEQIALICKAWKCFAAGKPLTAEALKLHYHIDEADDIRYFDEAPTIVGGIDIGEASEEDESKDKE